MLAWRNGCPWHPPPMRKEPRRGGFRMGWDFKEIPGGIIRRERPLIPSLPPRGRSPPGDFQMGAPQRRERPLIPRGPQRKEPARATSKWGLHSAERGRLIPAAPRGRSPLGRLPNGGPTAQREATPSPPLPPEEEPVRATSKWGLHSVERGHPIPRRHFTIMKKIISLRNPVFPRIGR